MPKPNIIYILADDMGYGDLSCYGATKIRTPHMDSIAEQGIRFTDAHASSAVCTPSRYSVLTGRYCWRTWLQGGVLDGFGAPLIEPERMTVASLLKQHGYHTACVGKWHLGMHRRNKEGERMTDENDASSWCGAGRDGFDVDYTAEIEGGPVDVGFDYFFGTSGSPDMAPYVFIENRLPVSVPTKEKDVYTAQQRKGLMADEWRDDMVDVTLTEKATAYINERAKSDEPFFLYLAPVAPHRPNVPPEFMRGKTEAGNRGDCVALVDWMVGEVLAALKQNNLTENTLIMVTSDNGARPTDYEGCDWGHLPNGILRGYKGDIYDGGHREPLVCMWSSVIEKGRVSDDLTCLSDLLATCAAIIGDTLPNDAGEDSFNILPILEGVDNPPQREAVVHHSLLGMFSLRKGDMKATFGLGSGGFTEPAFAAQKAHMNEGQLYDMRKNVQESHNLSRRNAPPLRRDARPPRPL